jgi:hypothetical protein
MRLRVVVAVVAFVVTLVTMGCGLYEDNPYALPTATPEQTNGLQNGGFETTEAWSANPPEALSISGQQAHSGQYSGLLRGSNDGASVSQQLSGGQGIPEFVTGFVRVPNWTPGPDQGEVGFRVTVHRGTDPKDGVDEVVHFVIGGLEHAPAGAAATEAYVFLRRGAPSTGSWSYFAYPVAAAFIQRFGALAPGDTVAVALELRGDGTQAWFDDLYTGSQLGNPNRPAPQ